ncbi:MAG: hypothetical protein PHO32_01355 [Candidatus Cloacimonetes bacterium]|nr:hypothetical protein [Candidatus Cloacimonadota bacterium]
MISRFKLPMWITSVCKDHYVCQGMQFSYAVLPVQIEQLPADWKEFMREQLKLSPAEGKYVVLVEVPSPENPGNKHCLEILDLTTE